MTQDEWKRFVNAEFTQEILGQVERELMEAVLDAPSWMPGRLPAAQAELKAFHRIRRRLRSAATARKPQ